VYDQAPRTGRRPWTRAGSLAMCARVFYELAAGTVVPTGSAATGT